MNEEMKINLSVVVIMISELHQCIINKHSANGSDEPPEENRRDHFSMSSR
jgi:hypothetical protein